MLEKTLIFWILIGLLTAFAMLIIAIPLFKLKRRLYFFLALPLLPVVALLSYHQIGASAKLEHYWVLKNEAATVKAQMKKFKNPQAVVNALKARLAADPRSAQGWYLLGRLYLGESRYSDAFIALSKAYYLQPKHTDYALGYAQAYFFAHHQKLDSATKALLMRLIEKNDQNVAAMNLLAIDAYMSKDYRAAVAHWEKMLQLFPAGSSDSKAILGMIAQAQKHIH